MKFAFIRAHGQQFPISRMCQVLNVSASGYYAWRQRPVSRRAQANQELVRHICAVHAASHQTYGSPRVHAELVAQGAWCGKHRVARLMRQHQIRARQARRHTVTTLVHPDDRVAANMLDRQFQAAGPNQKWLADITYVPTQEGWLYLAAILDLYARKVVGWAMGSTLSTDLTFRAFQMALQQRRPGAGLLHHSDRGSQYTSDEYQKLLKNQGFQVSMSRSGNCYDNAPMESFFATLKVELIHYSHYANRSEARRAIFAYIEGFYNRRRRPSRLSRPLRGGRRQGPYHLAGLSITAQG